MSRNVTLMVKLTICSVFWKAPIRGQIMFVLFVLYELLWMGLDMRVWDLPYMTHRKLLLLLGCCLPVLDEIYKRSMNFVSTCLSHTSSLVKYVAHHSIRFRLNFSLSGRNVLFCSRRYGFHVSDVLTNSFRFISDTIYSCARAEVTGVHVHEDDLLFECILIRDCQAALPCWFPRSDVNYVCTV